MGTVIKKYKYIRLTKPNTIPLFKDRPRNYWIENNKSGEKLATIYYYPAWNRYVVEFYYGVVWSDDCLAAVQDFVRTVTKLELRSEITNHE